MRRAVMKLLLLAGTATLALAGAGQALAAGFHGTVVGKERARHALVIASGNAMVRTVRVTGAYRLRPGTRVAVKADRLRDGTYRATALRRVGQTSGARASGTILRSRRGSYLLGAGKSVLAIRYRAGRRLSSASGGPRPGDQVVVRISISRNGALIQQGVQTVAHGARLEVVGILTALTNATATTPGSVTVTVEMPGAPPAPATKTDFTCGVPAGFPDLSAFLNKLVEVECMLMNGQWALEKLGVPGQRGVEDDDDEDEDEVEGRLTALTPATATITGSITVGNVTCTIPAGFDTLGIKVGDEVEIECEARILTDIEQEDGDNDDD